MDGHAIYAIRIPWFEIKLSYKHGNDYHEKIDDRIHLLAMLLALYPFTDNDSLAKEFCLSKKQIMDIAHLHHIYKSDEQRSCVNRKNGMLTKQSRAYYFINKREKNGISRKNQ